MCTLKNSWWWAEELSETCSFIPKINWEISASNWFYYKHIYTQVCTPNWSTCLNFFFCSIAKCSLLLAWGSVVDVVSLGPPLLFVYYTREHKHMNSYQYSCMSQMYNVPTVMYCTQHYWVSRLCTLPQNTVIRKCVYLQRPAIPFVTKPTGWLLTISLEDGNWPTSQSVLFPSCNRVDYTLKMQAEDIPKIPQNVDPFLPDCYSSRSVPREPTSCLACPFLLCFVSNTTWRLSPEAQ